jgi:AcrR family transcriptional regulator
MSIVSDPTQARIVDAALAVFARYGFRRASMADVAREAGVARATLYLAFKDKAALFGFVAGQVVDRALTAAAAAWRSDANLADNIEALLLAKDLPLFRLLHLSPHGAELLAVDADVTRTHAQRLHATFEAAVAALIAATPSLDLQAFGGPEGFARFVTRAGGGLKSEAESEAVYHASVRQFAEVTARAARPLPSPSRE